VSVRRRRHGLPALLLYWRSGGGWRGAVPFPPIGGVHSVLACWTCSRQARRHHKRHSVPHAATYIAAISRRAWDVLRALKLRAFYAGADDGGVLFCLPPLPLAHYLPSRGMKKQQTGAATVAESAKDACGWRRTRAARFALRCRKRHGRLGIGRRGCGDWLSALCCGASRRWRRFAASGSTLSF